MIIYVVLNDIWNDAYGISVYLDNIEHLHQYLTCISIFDVYKMSINWYYIRMAQT